ncbi:MAG: hypothetical protein ACREAA_14330 [Candidatus Polarisedimenticolia bacterium]
MIPLPGLVLLVWMLRVCRAVLAISCLASILAIRSAHVSWRAGRPGTAAERLAWILVVPGLICLITFLPPPSLHVLIESCLPALVSLATVSYVRRGNRRRGHASLGGPRILRIALASLVGSVLLLVASGLGVRAEQARRQRRHEAELARGRSHQDDFRAIVAADGIVVAGETSTPPAQDDDAWMLMLDRSLEVRRAYAPPLLHRQTLHALAAAGDDLVAGGQDDERPVWLRFTRTGDPTARTAWPWPGGVYALAPLNGGTSLVAGERDGEVFIASVDVSGSETWSVSPPMKGRLVAMATDGHSYLAAGSDDPLAMPGSMTVLAGGTTDGKGSWTKTLGESRFSPATHDLAVLAPDAFLALGTTGEAPERLSDLWLARISADGTLLEERTFGGARGEASGGLAVAGSRVFVAGYRFAHPHDELWLLELDAGGNTVWEKTYEARTHGRPLALAATREGHLVLAGYREAEDLHRDGWVGLFDSEGRLLTQRTYP